MSDRAQTILAWVRRKALAAFSLRDAHRSLHRQFAESKDLDEPLLELTLAGHLRPVPAHRSDRLLFEVIPSPRAVQAPAPAGREEW